MQSRITLEIEIEHGANLPDAQRIAQIVADAIAPLTRAEGGGYTFGRRTVRGREDGDNVQVFLRAAAITSLRERCLRAETTRDCPFSHDWLNGYAYQPNGHA